ncbi:hypothetical protein WJX73_000732 [Symbiochloris irregularis]|uniref:Uncharacterized protein n=1 Tax=Symbiochloris irregularis TaxID=706552 RepID=A0AAW1PVW5_9CHLO
MAVTTPAAQKQAVAAFESLGLRTELAEAAAALGWKSPSPVQQQAIPLLIQGRDVIGLAETGSGKTAAFALPILQGLLSSDAKRTCAFYALILSPTRELALQIKEQVEALGSCIAVRCAALVGGIDLASQAVALGKAPHIVVGTPGRVVDHLSNTKGFSLKLLKHLVLDEADRLLHMDFEQEIDQILKVAPKERRTQLFSATMTSKVAKLQRACLADPVKVEVTTKYQTVATLRQQFAFVPAKFKDCYLAYFLTEVAGSAAMVFTRTCDSSRRLALLLRNLGFGAVPIHGHMSQPKRIGALNKFKGGERSLLICTDVASRGLDIPAVDVVINYNVPTNSKDYVHRVGRTARAGRSGRALTLVTQYDVELFQRIEALTGQRMEQFSAPEDAVMLLLERTNEAQRIATIQMKDGDKDKSGKRKGKRAGDDEDDRDMLTHKHYKKRY